MKKVLCFGDILLRLSPDTAGNWIDEAQMPVYTGGAELNVAQALARWKIPVSYFTAMPENYLSECIVDNLNKKGVGTERIRYSGDRIGLYYLAQGKDMKNAGVIYDRAGSSTATLQPGQIDWDTLLDGIDWLHFTAISPAISASLAAVCLEAVRAAAGKGITVSVDLNYRAKLWKYGKTPVEIMPELAEHCDLILGNIWAAEMMLGIPLEPGFEKNREQCLQQSRLTAQQVFRKYPRCRQVAHTFRFDEGESMEYYACLHTPGTDVVSETWHPRGVIDRVGSGDCFMAGIIYGNIMEHTPQEIISFSAAAAVDKLFITGDATTSSVEQIRQHNRAATK